MAHGKSLQLRNIQRPPAIVLYKSWELNVLSSAVAPTYRTFPPAQSSDRAERKAGQRVKRLAAKARRQAQVRS